VRKEADLIAALCQTERLVGVYHGAGTIQADYAQDLSEELL
jgi:hypothetical protein